MKRFSEAAKFWAGAHSARKKPTLVEREVLSADCGPRASSRRAPSKLASSCDRCVAVQ